MSKQRVAVIGAGPGGLAAAMLLAHRGVDVTVFEKQPFVGGRTSRLQVGEFTFDRGPTFLNMPYILEEIFEETGRDLHDYVEMKRLEPMYDLYFDRGTRQLSMTTDRDQMHQAIEAHFPGNGEGYERFMSEQAIKLSKLMPVLQTAHDKLTDYVSLRVLKALPFLSIGKSLYDVLSEYFTSEELKYAFTFQAKYLGMSAWECPGGFSILSYMEHAYGVHHPIGGVNQLCHAMAKVVEEEGGSIRLGEPVERLLMEDKKVTGLVAGSVHYAFDEVVIGADFAHAMTSLVPDGKLSKWSPAQLKKKRYSCSTFMLYLGLDHIYEDVAHHSIHFADDYELNVKEMTQELKLSEDFSFYVQNASRIDPTLAPAGKSSLYVLVPVPNNLSGLPWEELKTMMTERVLDALETRSPYRGIRQHIEVMETLTPVDWETFGVYEGATFNLGHNLSQMMYFRPHNQFEELDNVWLVGGGTHPGSGLPTIFESARITTNLLRERAGVGR
ncbi:phytoene desaturase family protein [Exiguobacterium sp. AT1b]|uniref:phytoene desaturase family protein n=1 Tax=Exiguobacterium sp. (strain ATCC BAA-1283 / AT1b) TaxID=360911 RepID=UPI00093DE433|nr:phytoene desaturase family protein [Exiguobacterium sp. AT1b]